MTKVPVLIFHKNYENYLKINCEITSQNNEVIVLGDKSSKDLEKIDNVSFYNYEDFINFEKIDYYKKYFKTYNSKSSEIVWLWYFRLFAIIDFLEQKKIKTIFHIDSDNILLKNINEIQYKHPNAYLVSNDWTDIHMSGSIHSGRTTLDFYKLFEDLYKDVFINKTKLDLLKNKIDYHEKNGGGGICDMTFYYLIDKLDLLSVDNLMLPKGKIGNRTVFMNNFGNGEGYNSKNQYEMNGKYIKIYKNKKLKKNLIFDIVNDEFLEIINIHFQGKAKRKMNKLLRYKYFI